jgi:hypothetical protein
MNANSTAPEGKRPLLTAASREVTPPGVNESEAPIEQAKASKKRGIDVGELQMAGFFSIPQQRRK